MRYHLMIGISIKAAPRSGFALNHPPRSGFALAVELSEWNEIYISNTQMSTLELMAALSAKQNYLIQPLRTYVHKKHSKDQSLQRYVQKRVTPPVHLPPMVLVNGTFHGVVTNNT